MISNCSIAAALAILSVSGLAKAQQDAIWNNQDGGVWSDAANWVPAVVPNNNGDSLFSATLNLQAQPYVVTLDIDVTLQNFSLLWGGTVLNLEDRSLRTNGDLRVVGGLLTRGTRGGPGGLVEVGGDLILDGARFMNAGTITTNGSVSFNGSANIDICNTGVDHRGAGTMSWDGGGNINIAEGGSLSNGAQSTFAIGPGADRQITGDGTGTLRNDGLLINGDASRGKSGTTIFNGVNFFNTGTVTVDAGALIINSANDLAVDGVLSEGIWNIRNGSLLSLSDAVIRDLGAEVSISGANSSFSNIADLRRVREGGRFSISDGQNFVANDRFSNNGEVEVGTGSTFDASADGLGNLDGDAIFGGSFIVAGDFITGVDSIRRLESNLVLSGENARFGGIESLERVGSSGGLSLENGRVFETAGDLDVEQGGRVRVGAGSALNISGGLLANGGSVLGGGNFEIAGTLSAQNLRITEIATDLTLAGDASQILNADGSDALSGLNLITQTGGLRLRDGRSLIGLDNLTVQNLLSIDGAEAPQAGDGDRVSAPGTVQIRNNLTFTETSTLELIINGRDPGLYGRVISGTTDVFEGATLSLIVDLDANLVLGDGFLLLDTTLLDGRFSNILVSGLDDGLLFEIDQTATGIFARVVPTPGVLGFFAAAGLLRARRRR
jgi:hypothetical protein